MRSSNSVNVVNLVMMDVKYEVQIYIIHIRYTACSVKRCMQSCVPYNSPAGGVWLYCATTALLSDLLAELTACTAMLVYILFLSSPVKL